MVWLCYGECWELWIGIELSILVVGLNVIVVLVLDCVGCEGLCLVWKIF